MMRSIKARYFITIVIIAFLLHIVWENAQAPLYAGYQSFFVHFPVCLIGTVGDVVITILTLMLVLLLKKQIPQTAPDFLALAIIGFITAIAIEQHALLVGKWNYSQTMPLIPWLNVGLAPILQMTILLPLSFYIANLLNKKSYEKI